MSEFEIITSYRQAKTKSQQITILAEINLCERSDIIELLRLNGVYSSPSSVGRRWTEAECRRLDQLLDRNVSTRELAALYGFKPNVMASTIAYLRSQGKLQQRINLRRGRQKNMQLQTA